MDVIIKICRGLGLSWCWKKPRVKDRINMESFLSRRLPIFWIMGPPGFGKTEVGNMLQSTSGYLFVKISDLLYKERLSKGIRSEMITHFMKNGEPVVGELVVDLIKDFIRKNYIHATGFIISGFPLNLHQAKIFELQVTKVNIIVYCTLKTEDMLMNMPKHAYKCEGLLLREHNQLQSVYRHYENKTIKVTTAPNKETFRLLIRDLATFWGYKFVTNNRKSVKFRN